MRDFNKLVIVIGRGHKVLSTIVLRRIRPYILVACAPGNGVISSVLVLSRRLRRLTMGCDLLYPYFIKGLLTILPTCTISIRLNSIGSWTRLNMIFVYPLSFIGNLIIRGYKGITLATSSVRRVSILRVLR